MSGLDFEIESDDDELISVEELLKSHRPKPRSKSSHSSLSSSADTENTSEWDKENTETTPSKKPGPRPSLIPKASRSPLVDLSVERVEEAAASPLRNSSTAKAGFLERTVEWTSEALPKGDGASSEADDDFEAEVETSDLDGPRGQAQPSDDESDEDVQLPVRKQGGRRRIPQILADSDDEEEDDVSDNIPDSAPGDKGEPDSDIKILEQDTEELDEESFYDAMSHKSEVNEDARPENEDAGSEIDDLDGFVVDDDDVELELDQDTRSELDEDTVGEDSEFYSDDYEGSDSEEQDSFGDGILSYSPPSIVKKAPVIGLDSSPVSRKVPVISLDSPTEKKMPKNPQMSSRAFKKNKVSMAINFLDHMEDKVNFGRLWRLTEATGGIKITWNKRLLTTAGRAKVWRVGPYDGAVENPDVLSDPKNKTRYHAEIELSEKVVDSVDRLANTLAHEYAHICVMLLHDRGKGGKDAAPPHGREFSRWGKKITSAMGLENVSRCHNYEIQFKYIWECVRCQHHFRRQSKSIDTARHRCQCHGRLVQIKPAARSTSSGEATSKYNQFVKDKFAAVRESMGPSTPARKVMEELGRQWKLNSQNQDQEGKKREIIDITDDLSLIEL